MVDFPEEVDFTAKDTALQTPAARAGAGVREVRERLGWKLPDIAERLRIRPVFLSAIEAGDLSCLPGAAYRAGFLRSYARALGLDGEEILQRFRDAGQIDEADKSELKLLVPVPDRGVPRGAIIFIAFILAIGGYGLWYHHTEQTREVAQDVLQIPAKLQPLTTPPKVTPPPSSDTKAASVGTAIATAPAAPAKSESTPPPATAPTASQNSVTSTVNTSSPETNAANPTPTPSVASPSDSAAPASTTSADESASQPAAANSLVISATQPSWIQVTAPNGTILFSKVLNPGQSWPVPQMPGLKITTGNAGGTILSVDGKTGQPMGTQGTVLHNYQLTPAAQGSTAPASSSTGAAAAP